MSKNAIRVQTRVRPTNFGHVGFANRFERVEKSVEAFQFMMTTTPQANSARRRAHEALLKIGLRVGHKYKQSESSRSCVDSGALIRFIYVVNTSSKNSLFPIRLMETKILGSGRSQNDVFSKLKKGIQHGNFGFSSRDYQAVYRYLWIPQADIDLGKWDR